MCSSDLTARPRAPSVPYRLQALTDRLTESFAMATPAQWIEGARPRTLPAAISPVLVGTGAAAYLDGFVWWKALLALGVALALQIGVNYANDYSDGIRGTDENRVGPLRLVGSKVATPGQVKAAAFTCFGLATLDPTRRRGPTRFSSVPRMPSE